MKIYYLRSICHDKFIHCIKNIAMASWLTVLCTCFFIKLTEIIHIFGAWEVGIRKGYFT